MIMSLYVYFIIESSEMEYDRIDAFDICSPMI